MCCDTKSQHGQGHKSSCGCGGTSCFGPAFWSKKKRIQMVENSIECLQTKVADLQELLQELKNE
jgi:hypothetical protein